MAADGALIREVFARFGRAYYFAECLHRELCASYALATFKDRRDATRPRVEEKLSFAFSLPLGKPTQELQPFLPMELFLELQVGVDRRNFLSHHFWYDRVHQMLSDDGLAAMASELEQMAEMFSELDDAIHAHFEELRQRMGVTHEVFQESLEEVQKGIPVDPLPARRTPRKQERIINVWDVPHASGGLGLVFQSEDRALWQFCDVGVGWATYDQSESSWRVNDAIQAHLPAMLEMRPKLVQPWDCELALGPNVVLWVRRSKREDSFRWGLRQRSVHG